MPDNDHVDNEFSPENASDRHSAARWRELLVDLHLERISAHDRSALHAELRSNPELREASVRLGRILQPLDHWRVPRPPADLADHVLSHVADRTGAAFKKREESASFETPPPDAEDAPQLLLVGNDGEGKSRERGAGPISFLFGMREVLAVAACLLIVFTLMVPSLRQNAREATCRANLQEISKGVAQYQQVSQASLPFGGILSSAPWLPTAAASHPDPRQPRQSNSRHAFLLLRLKINDSDDFVCPSSQGKPMRVANLDQYHDFASALNNSYDSLNMAGDDPPVRPDGAIPYMADRSPLFANGAFDPNIDPETTNSPTHNGAGQNVLRLDGSVEWTTSPLVGLRKDNVWLSGNRRRYVGTETVTGPDDSMVIPGNPNGTATADREATSTSSKKKQ